MIYCVKVHDLLKDADEAHGSSVLVDRLWPRGIAKDDLDYDHWLKDVAPSPDLRKWFGHKEERFQEFSRRYKEELDASESDDLEKLRSLADDGDVTLLYAAADRDVNHARVLAEWLS